MGLLQLSYRFESFLHKLYESSRIITQLRSSTHKNISFFSSRVSLDNFILSKNYSNFFFHWKQYFSIFFRRHFQKYKFLMTLLMKKKYSEIRVWIIILDDSFEGDFVVNRDVLYRIRPSDISAYTDRTATYKKWILDNFNQKSTNNDWAVIEFWFMRRSMPTYN